MSTAQVTANFSATTPAAPAAPTPANQVAESWAKFGAKTAKYKEQIQALGLQIQQAANSADLTSIESTAATMATIKKLHKEMVDTRKLATAPLDEVKEKLMAPEKEYDPAKWPVFKNLEETNLTLRLAAEKAAKAAAAKEQEKVDFRTFCEKQHIFQKEAYAVAVSDFLQAAYESALTKGAKPDLQVLHEAALKLPRPILQKYGEFKYITQDEALDIFKTIPRNELTVTFEQVGEKFGTFEIDLVRKEEALKESQAAAEAKKAEAAQKARQERVITQLTAAATVPTVETPKIKRSVAVELPTTPEAALAILATFTANFTTLTNYLGVRDWSNLTVKQMAVAIGKYTTETGDELARVIYVDVVK